MFAKKRILAKFISALFVVCFALAASQPVKHGQKGKQGMKKTPTINEAKLKIRRIDASIDRAIASFEGINPQLYAYVKNGGPALTLPVSMQVRALKLRKKLNDLAAKREYYADLVARQLQLFPECGGGDDGR